ncbi:glycoside hydrolase family 3 N-terminal domain-containing protein [Arenimonas sp. MALMAid1274]|uniref:glycoside hydrolase family 3 protein n=1 Tax=Arenimonas sp. MALMAid1274 TaxID=3411630 RepID=UPI003B9E7B5E
MPATSRSSRAGLCHEMARVFLFASLLGAGIAAASEAPSSKGVADPSQWPAITPPVQDDPALIRRVDALLASLSLEQKVGQLVQGDIGSMQPADLERYPLGSILAGGNSDPGGRYNASPAEWLALADAYHRASLAPHQNRPGVPVLFGIDAVHGQNNVVGATVFPHNIGLGATRNPDLVRRIAEVTAVEARVTGFDWTFAPTLAVPQDDRWGRTYEGYSEDPAIVASFAAAVVEGIQGKVGAADFLGPRRVVASAKHFVGDGGTFEGRDQGDAQISEAELRDIHAPGYVEAMRAGVQTVMASFSGWNGVKHHGNRSLLTGVIKQRWQFDGFIVGDWNAHGQIPGCTNEKCTAAVEAGLDMYMAPDSWKGIYTSLLAAARSGELPIATIDDAARRVLLVKARAGVLDASLPSSRELAGDYALLGSAEHRAVARQAVRESLVLLKNDGVLPIRPTAHVLIAGDGADSIAKQSGGWTLSWQGTGTTNADFPNGQSIGGALVERIQAAGGRAALSAEGEFTDKPDVAVVVFGEDPYAEFQGDIADLRYSPGDDADLALMKRLADAGIPVVAVFISGRPLWVNRELNVADAFVAVWLPGSEGGGVADVLLAADDGSVAHDFKGRLSFSWPKRADQARLNRHHPDYEPLFPLGFGLTYAQPRPWQPLPEDPGVVAAAAQRMWFSKGATSDGFSWQAPAGSVAPAARAVDHLAQEDAREFSFPEAGAIALTAGTPLNLEREANGDVRLELWLNIEGEAAGELALGCGAACPHSVPLDSLPRKQWLHVGTMLKCFRADGAMLGQVDAPFVLHGHRGAKIRVASIGLGQEARVVLPCPQK